MEKNEIFSVNGSSIVMYTSEDGTTNLDVKLENETVWLTRLQMANLFGRDVKTIGKHINNNYYLKQKEKNKKLLVLQRN